MTGLEKILDRIKAESEASVNSIIAEAEEKCREIIKSAENQAEIAVSDCKNRAEEECRQLADRAKSSAEHIRAQNLLRSKRDIIDEVIIDAEKSLLGLSDREYFDVMAKLFEQNISGTGEIIFNEADKKRLPADFDLKGHKLSDKCGDFSGGFVLDYGDIEINCTVSALFEGAYEELSDTVNGILFRGV